jgi:hypothetical protein
VQSSAQFSAVLWVNDCGIKHFKVIRNGLQVAPQETSNRALGRLPLSAGFNKALASLIRLLVGVKERGGQAT